MKAAHIAAKTPPTNPTAPTMIGAAVLAAAFPVLVPVPIIFAPTEEKALISPATAVCRACGTLLVYHASPVILL
jgi:hypothetical protein